MVVSGQLRALATSGSGKDWSVLTEEEEGWVPDLVWTFWKMEKLIFLRILQPRAWQIYVGKHNG